MELIKMCIVECVFEVTTQSKFFYAHVYFSKNYNVKYFLSSASICRYLYIIVCQQPPSYEK